MLLLYVIIMTCLDDVIKETGNGKRSYSTGDGGDGVQIRAFSDFFCKIAFKNAVFGSGAGVNNSGAWTNHRISNKSRLSSRRDNDAIICEV